MNINYFQACQTIEELKKQYRTLAKKFHPDVNRDKDTTKIMQQINKEYEYLFSMLETPEDKKQRHNVNDGYRDIINAIIHMPINIDIIGTWVWVYESYKVMQEVIPTLKELKFHYSSKQKKWFYNGDERKGKSFSKLSYDQISTLHGKEEIKKHKTSNKTAPQN